MSRAGPQVHFYAEPGTIPVTVSSAFSDDTRPHFSVEDEEVDATTHVVDVAGEVDLYSAPELKSHVLDAIDSGKTNIVVDLTHTTFIDSTTLGVLVGARKRLRERNGMLAVVCPDTDKLGLFEMTGLDRVFSIHMDRDGALAAIRS
jgi:anti-sigma B factor antagonist